MSVLAGIGEAAIGDFAIGDYQIIEAGRAGGQSELTGSGTVVAVGEGHPNGTTTATATATIRLAVTATAAGETTVAGAVTLPPSVRSDDGVVDGDRTGTPEDMAFPFAFDSTGDAATVRGESFYEQHALLLGAGVLESLRGNSLTANDIIEIEDTVERAYAASPYFTPPIRVNVTAANDSEIVIEASFDENNSVTVPITQRDVETIQG